MLWNVQIAIHAIVCTINKAITYKNTNTSCSMYKWQYKLYHVQIANQRTLHTN